jgi:hypothetical protein
VQQYIDGQDSQAPIVVSTDLRYLGHRFDNYARAWLGEWTVDRIREHRDAHQAGRIFAGKRLCRFFRRDSNYVGALGQRVAPWLATNHVLVGGDERLRLEVEPQIGLRGPMLTPPVLREMAEDLASCGLAVLQNVWRPRPDGSRWDVVCVPWDLEFVDTDSFGRLYAITTEGRIPIHHGDGKWIVARTVENHPYEHGAVVPLALHIADRGHTIVDGANAKFAIGNPKMHATLPEKIGVQDPVGKSLEAAVAELWQGVRHIMTTAGTKLEKLEFSGGGYQLFPQSLKISKTDIFFALTGQDGSATNEGGSYAKAQFLQGVLRDWVTADTQSGGTAFTTGLLQPYAAVNRGDSSLAPILGWPLPDPENAERLKALAVRILDYCTVVERYQQTGHVVTPQFARDLARVFEVPAPELEQTLQAMAKTQSA